MDVTLEQLDAVTLSGGRHDRIAEELLILAEKVGAGSSVTRAELLIAAADQHGFAGDAERRAELCREAVRDGGQVPPDARCYLVAALLDRGYEDEAQPYIDALRQPGHHVHVYEFLGETLEGSGRYLEALEVFATGLHDPQTSRFDRSMLLHGRRRCREELGLPADSADQRALADLQPADPPVDREVDLIGYVPAWVWDMGEGPDESFDEQVRRLERELQHEPSGLPVRLVDTGDLPTYAAARGLDPRAASTLRRYLLEADRSGRTMPWPPGRNDPCWCGRGVKYKRCCGRP